jgi:enterochelin esterase family protein
MRIRFALTLLAALCDLTAQPRPSPVRSPEVHADRKVTLRVLAPQAREVTVNLDYTGDKPAMTKGDGGVWSVTLGPLEPSLYIYSFNIDGVAVPDPVNPFLKPRARTSASIMEIPAPGPVFWDAREVPHGRVEINYRSSKVTGDTRAYLVYTPPGYANSKARYPVLYLLHGNNDTAQGWTLVGRANFILDNLLAAKQAVPMIVVMPFGHAAPYGASNNGELFERYLLEDVMPAVESGYRIAPGRASRAIAGLSMGGGQSLSIGLGHLDLFSHVAAFSAAVPRNPETAFAGVLQDAKAANGRLKLLWFACGKGDSLFGRSEQLAALLESRGVRHTWVPTEGVHNFAAWQKYLHQLAPLLFR